MAKCFTGNAEHEVSRRDIFDHVKGLGDINKVDDIKQALEILRKHGYVRLKPHVHTSKRGRPPVAYEVNMILDPCFT